MAPPSLAPAAALFLAALLLLSASPAAAARPRSSSKANGKHDANAASTTSSSAAGPHDILAVFAFGDSTLDPGNNNRLLTVVRADHAPYGRAFPAGVPPSGRFSDGKLITDYIVAALGIKDLLPAYHASGVTHANATTGVSFASGGSGLDDLTARTVHVSTFSSQIDDFQQLLSRIGEPQAADIASKSLFILSAGTNDVTMNYFDMPFRALEYPTIDAYHDYLISRYQSYIQRLYKLGARRFIVAGMPPVGCLPMQKSLRGQQPPLGHGCVDLQNEETQRYNAKLQKALAALEADTAGASLSYVDTYAPLMDMVAQPKKYGFTETGQGCCGTGLLEMGVLCTGLLPQCKSPAQYMFFDAVHPTQAAYKAVADQIIKTHVSQFSTN